MALAIANSARLAANANCIGMSTNAEMLVICVGRNGSSCCC